MSRRESSTSCRTSDTRSYRWVAVLTIFAMLGFAGFVLANTGANVGTKVVTQGQDAAEKKTLKPVTADGPTFVRPPAGTGGDSPAAPLAPPANDDCTGAIVIPSGSLPVLTTPVDITEATPSGSVNGEGDEGLLSCATIESTIWYSFTPTISGQYLISSCKSLAPGTNLVDTVIGVFASSGGSCPETTELGCNDTGVCRNVGVDDTSQAAAILSAGTTYFIAVGHWAGVPAGATDTPGPGNNTIQLQIDISPAPANDNCSAPTVLQLNRQTAGTTAAATNDYRSANSCFTGVGQILSSSNGLDVVFSFTPPSAGQYSFRYVQDDASAALRTQSPVLYLSTSCPGPNPGAAVPNCIGGANRMNDQATGNGNRSEEIKCVSLAAGTPYYLFFDDRFTGNPGGPLHVEVTECHNEVEPNGDIASATPYVPNSSCFMEGSAIPTGPAGDVDFFSLGNVPAGAKLFVGVDSAASNASDYELRVTSSTDTLGYDNDDGTSWVGSNAPIVAGPIAPGGDVYARVNSGLINVCSNLAGQNTPCTAGNIATACRSCSNSPATPCTSNAVCGGGATVCSTPAGTTCGPAAGNEPYELFARVETGAPQSEDTELMPDGPDFIYERFLEGTQVSGGGHVTGIMNSQTDEDCFTFVAHEGDQITAFADNNPARVAGTITNVWPIIQLLGGNPTPGNTRFIGQVLRNNVTASPGTLTGVTPSVTSNFMHYRARYTGQYGICYAPTQDVNSTENPPAGAYPLPWQGSISLNCGPIVAPGPSDLSITKSGPVGTQNTGDFFDYVITVTNNSATEIAQEIRVQDTLPPELTFLGLFVNDGFNGTNTFCFDIPTAGANDTPIDCTNVSLAPGASITYTVRAQVNNCSGAGQLVSNTASIETYTTDPNSANNSATWVFTTTESGSCVDTICDGSGCIANACTVNDSCSGGVCNSTPLNCDDSSLCTDDSCDPTDTDENPCINDSSSLGDLCFDGNDCTADACDPDQFCVFPPASAGTSCDDFLGCTNSDACDGNGFCLGASVCDDGQPCTDDFADEANNCACDNPVSFPGTMCSDGNSCTTGEVCDGNGGSVANCNGGTGITCNDDNPCTDDTCDPGTGCVFTNNSASCDDGDACTSGDTCGGGTCNGGGATVCDDGNACTDDTCDSGTGCVYTNNSAACDDGSACTTGDVCGGGSCGGTAVVCNDGNGCTDDSCDAGSGCVYTNNSAACNDGNACTVGDTCSGGSCGAGAPVVCSASDQCHVAGSCNPGTGLCSDPAAADGTACSDGNPNTTPDTCQSGVCTPGGSACEPTNDPKTWGWWHSQCTSGGHSGESIDNADAACVAAQNPAFAGITTAAQVCAVLDPSHGSGSSDKAQRHLMATALNVCSQRICPTQGLDATCSNAQTVGQAVTSGNAVLLNAGSTNPQFAVVECQAREINNGHALEFDTLVMKREAGNVRLTWIAPTLDDGTGTPRSYKIWRRPMGSMAAFSQVGTTTGLTYLDTSSGTTIWQYEVTSVN